MGKEKAVDLIIYLVIIILLWNKIALFIILILEMEIILQMEKR